MSSFDALDVDHGGLLSDATLSALQLRQQPFTATAADGDTFSDDTTAEQLSDIKQALINGDDLLLILGEAGAGKSTLLSQLGANSGMRIQCFSVKGSQRFSTMNLFAGMLEAFKQKPAADLKSMLDQLIPCLQSMIAGNTLSAIVLDDADQVNESELTRLLSGMLYVNSQDETLLRIALAAPSVFEDHIPDLLPEGADLPYSSLTIDHLNSDRATSYLDFRLNQAGYFEEFPFSDREVSTMVEQSDGLPTRLHGAAADLLNERHGVYEESIPPELLAEGGGITAGKGGKLLLGAVAGALIIGGLVLFKKPGNEVDDDRYRVVEQRKIEADANKISLVNEAEKSSTSGDSATTASTAVSTDNEAGSNENDTASNDSDASGDSNSNGNSASSSGSADNTSNTDSESASNTSSAPDATSDNGSQSANGAADNVDQSSPENDAGATADDAETPPEQDSGQNSGQNSEQSNNSNQVDQSASNGDSDAIAEPAAEADDTANTNSVIESPNWILTQDASLFTVQMSASTDRAVVEQFLTRNPLEPPNSVFSFDRNGTTWYALVHGLYPSIDAARAAVERLPPAAQTNQPWIRAVGRIQKALKEQN